MKLTLFVGNAASTASQPGESSNVLRLNLPPKGDKIDDENGSVFPNPATKSAYFEASGVSDEEIAAFKGGQRVTVTIEVAK